jgi:methylenetetrahydrofolate reductase (NADPH)
MHLTRLWQSRRTTVSFEVFPARTPKAAAAQEQAITELLGAKPDFVSVTFGAGGSTRAGSADLVAMLRGRGVETLAYFAAYGLGPSVIHEVMDRYRALGVENVLAVRGDRPEDAAFVAHPESLPHASDLIGLLHADYPFCLGAAAYPEGHREAVNPERDLEALRLKVDRGAAFAITQYCHVEGRFGEFLGRARAAGVTVPVVAGVMPIFSVKMTQTLADLCGATIPESLRAELGALPPDDPEALARFGIELATRQCREALAAGAAGLHFYTMNKSRAAVAVVGQLRAEGLV